MSDRAANGRFAGVPGPGNPHARAVARLRTAIYREITPAVLTRIVRAVVALAEQGDLEAAKIILDRTLGRPVALDLPVPQLIEAILASQARQEAPVHQLVIRGDLPPEMRELAASETPQASSGVGVTPHVERPPSTSGERKSQIGDTHGDGQG